MRRRLQWSRDALDDLKNQISYIAADSPNAARKVATALEDAATALADIPTGRPGRVAGTYEKSVTRLPYIIAYVVETDTITIVRVIHTARDWPREKWPAD